MTGIEFPTLPTISSPTQFLKEREYGRVSFSTRAKLRAHMTRKLPSTLRESPFVFHKLKEIDKVFTSMWLNENQILFGSKDNQLILWDLSSSSGKNSFSIALPSSSLDVSNDESHSCGLHFISPNSTGNLIATGGQSPNEIALLHRPSLSPVALLKGHTDWVFGVDWIAPNLLVSGGRDAVLKLWRCDPDHIESTSHEGIGVLSPLLSRKEHKKKLREVKSNLHEQMFATVSADQHLLLWDSNNLDVKSSIHLEGENELVCMNWDSQLNIIAVGSQHHGILVDPRISKVITKVMSRDVDWGVRSVGFTHGTSLSNDVMTIGGGMGHLGFFDLRAGKFLEVRTGTDPTYLETGDGWLCKDDLYYSEFLGMTVPNAVYTHTFSPSGSRLFIGGGPLMCGLKGSYVSVWS